MSPYRDQAQLVVNPYIEGLYTTLGVLAVGAVFSVLSVAVFICLECVK